ncbi:protein FAM237A isoform X2 [Alligator sinensis]|uniref:Protein FAM237A isoform X2 n=1 Tax=Alligator sinensis TaxID=38654 RepID=A0A3Q0H431_ALLSI|nr:protein FAM237A isoform X2 [Alligator sinensis]
MSLPAAPARPGGAPCLGTSLQHTMGCRHWMQLDAIADGEAHAEPPALAMGGSIWTWGRGHQPKQGCGLQVATTWRWSPPHAPTTRTRLDPPAPVAGGGGQGVGGAFSHLQRILALKKKELIEDFVSIHVHKSGSTLLGRVTGDLGIKRKQHL